MLLVDHPDGKVAVAQPSHAWISGQLARAWAGLAKAGHRTEDERRIQLVGGGVGQAESVHGARPKVFDEHVS